MFQIKKAKDGSLWFATNEGVARFDGHAFKTFGVAEGLIDPTVFSLDIDKDGVVWVNSYTEGIYSIKGDSARPIQQNDAVKKWTSENTVVSLIHRRDTLWIGLNYSAPKMIVGDSQVFDIAPHPDSGLIKSYAIEVSPGEYLYGGTFGNSTVLNFEVYPLKEKATRVVLPFPGYMSYIGLVSCRLSNGDWITTKNTEAYCVGSDGSYFRLPLPELYPKISAFEDKNGYLWVGTINNGVWVMDPENNYKVIGHHLPNLSVSSIVEDHEGGIWLSTLQEGIFYLPVSELSYWGLEARDPGGRANALCVYQDELLIASHSGKVLSLKPKSSFLPQEGIQLINGDLSAIHKLGDSILVMGVDGGRLLLPDKKIWVPQSNWASKKVVITPHHLLTMHLTLNIIDRKTITHKLQKRGGCRNQEMVVIGTDLWIGCVNGLMRISYLEKDPFAKANHLLEGRVPDLTQDEGFLYAATGAQGVAIVDKQNLEIEFINEATGLPSNQCQLIHRDSVGNLWVVSKAGITRLNRVGEQWTVSKTWTLDDGLDAGTIEDLLVYQDTLWVGAEGGVWSIPIATSGFNAAPPLLTITSVELVQGSQATSTDLAALQHYNRNLRFNFAGISFRNAGHQQYRYRMLGLDSAFQTTTEQKVYFPGLPPGTYTFQVQAVNNDGVWSPIEARSFTIPRPYWQTWWFYTLLFFACLGMVSSFLLYRSRMLNTQQKMQLALLESEQKALSAQINPHFLYNTMNSVQYFVTKAQPAKAADHLADVSMLMRKVLQNTSSSFVSVAEEIEILELYLHLEQIRFDHQFEYSIEYATAPYWEKVKIPSMVVQPHVENAIWHGLMKEKRNSGKITIRLEENKAALKWIIEDNGVGREAAKTLSKRSGKRHKSSGVRLTQERLKILSQQSGQGYSVKIIDLYAAENQPAGTRVEISMPPHGYHER